MLLIEEPEISTFIYFIRWKSVLTAYLWPTFVTKLINRIIYNSVQNLIAI